MREVNSNYVIKEVQRIVEKACSRDTNVFGYGIWVHHILHVVKIGKKLAERFGADPEIVEIAALLHDYAGIKDHSLHKENIIFPFPDQKSFSSYPPFQQLIENCINSLIKAYIPEGGHFTYGPMLLPSHLVHFLNDVRESIGWGINAFFAVIAHAKKIPQRNISLSVHHDPDVQEGEGLNRFRLEQLKEYIVALQEASKIIESL